MTLDETQTPEDVPAEPATPEGGEAPAEGGEGAGEAGEGEGAAV